MDIPPLDGPPREVPEKPSSLLRIFGVWLLVLLLTALAFGVISWWGYSSTAIAQEGWFPKALM